MPNPYTMLNQKQQEREAFLGQRRSRPVGDVGVNAEHASHRHGAATGAAFTHCLVMPINKEKALANACPMAPGQCHDSHSVNCDKADPSLKEPERV